jgi:hypothetical protein
VGRTKLNSLKNIFGGWYGIYDTHTSAVIILTQNLGFGIERVKYTKKCK